MTVARTEPAVRRAVDNALWERPARGQRNP